MQDLVSQIWSIPEVQDCVFGYSDPEMTVTDKARMMLVSKTWAAMIRPFLWYNVDDKSQPMRKKLEMITIQTLNPGRTIATAKEDIQQYAHWIRHLSIMNLEAVRLLGCPGTNCQRLLTLDLSYEITNSKHIWSLIRCNPLLIDLSLTRVGSTDVSTLDSNFGTRHLRRLNLDDIFVTAQSLQRIGENWPNVEVLIVKNCSILENDDNGHVDMNATSDRDNGHDRRNNIGNALTSREWSNVRQLTLSPFTIMDYIGYPHQELNGQLLSHCTQITDLTFTVLYSINPKNLFFDFVESVVTTLERERHKRLTNITLEGFAQDNGVMESGVGFFNRILDAIPSLTCLSLLNSIAGAWVLETILSNSVHHQRTSTLQSIEVRSCLYVPVDFAQQIFSNCPHLVSFKMDNTGHMSLAETLLDMDWICTSLQILEWTVAIADSGHNGLSEMLAATIGHLFHQLGNCSKLKILKLIVQLSAMSEFTPSEARVSMEEYYLLANHCYLKSIDICYREYKTANFYEILESPYVDWCRANWPNAKFEEYTRIVVDLEDDDSECDFGPHSLFD